MLRSRIWITTGLLTIWAAEALGQSTAPQLALSSFSAAAPGAPPAPWRVVGLPKGKAPLSRFEVVDLEGVPVLRVQSEHSYGTLVHEVPATVPAPTATLRWRWRLDEAVRGADLRRKDADDAALKVCVMFDMALDGIGFWERNLLRLARTLTGEKLPAATLCYQHDLALPAGTLLPNVYTPRVRVMILDSGESSIGKWQNHQRNLRADFTRAFGQESATQPPIIAVVIGGDSDNTGNRGLGHVGDVTLTP